MVFWVACSKPEPLAGRGSKAASKFDPIGVRRKNLTQRSDAGGLNWSPAIRWRLKSRAVVNLLSDTQQREVPIKT